jgi:hypothetical protein
MSYKTMDEVKLIETLSRDLQEAGTRLLTIAMASPNREAADSLVRASEAVLIAARKAGNHLSDYWERLGDT